MSEFTKDVEDYFCRFTFGQFVTLILIELVTLFFVFYLGARYGPDLIGARHAVAKREGLPTDSPASIDDIVNKKGTQSPQAPVQYTFPEVLTDSAADKPTKPAAKEGGAIKFKPSGVTVQEFENKKKMVLIPREEEEAAPLPSGSAAPATPSVEAKGKYAIQVGSYPTEEEANRMVEHWKQKGYSSFVSTGKIPNRGTWYRVRIGDFQTKDEATRYLGTFKEKEKTAALVVASQS